MEHCTPLDEELDEELKKCICELSRYLVQLPTNDDALRQIELVAQRLANYLRKPNGPKDYNALLGPTTLDLTTLLTAVLKGESTPGDANASTVFEILRVAVNLCVNHDQNRQYLLEAGFPQAVVSLLEGYSELLPPGPRVDPLPLSISHLQVIKTAIGVLLNASLGYRPVKFRLISLEVALTLVRLSSALYPVGSWMRGTVNLFPPSFPGLDEIPAKVEESWEIRVELANWAWRVITELKDDAHPLFDPQVLPYLVQPLITFTPPLLTDPPPPNFAYPTVLRTKLLLADPELLSDSCSQLESLVLDVEDIRLSLARGYQVPAEHQGVPCLSSMLDFIEDGNYSPLWYVQHGASLDPAAVRCQEKALDDCKSAIIKAVVEISGEDKNVDVLVDQSDQAKPGGAFVYRMVDWIRAFVTRSGRDDLASCATLSLGNLTRGEIQSSILLSPPHNIAQLLASHALLAPSTDIQLKHGAMGLLKHLSQSSCDSAANRAALSNVGAIERVLASGIWDERSPAIVPVVQMNAIGYVKHLCKGSVDNSVRMVLPIEGESPSSTGLSQILSLIKRSDVIAIKSEGTRVIVNLVKSLWTSDSMNESLTTEDGQSRQQKRERAILELLSTPSAEALAALLGRSMKHPILINEAVVALTLMNTRRDGALTVLRAIVAPLPTEVAPHVPESVSMSTTSSVISATASPTTSSPVARSRCSAQPRALDHLLTVLRNSPGSDGAVSALPSYAVEIRANICLLFEQLTKQTSGEDLNMIKEAVMPVLEDLRNNQASGRDALDNAARKVLGIWALE